MLNDLQDIQDSGEECGAVEFSVSVETHSVDEDTSVKKEFTFDYAKEWDKWVFIEYKEFRRDSIGAGWTLAQHFLWHEGEERSISVPTEALDGLRQVTTAEEITVQLPADEMII